MQTIRLALLAALAPLAFPQALPQFEVASFKPSAPGADYHVNLGYHIDGAMVSCSHLSLRDLIRIAYLVKDYQIAGPEWLATDRFDMSAKLPDGAKQDQVRDMIKSALAERFHLKVHTESKEFPVYGLIVIKGGIHIKESPHDEAPEEADTARKPATEVAASGGPEGVTVNIGKGSSFAFGDNGLQATKLTMPAFADLLSRFVDRPVVDMTGLTGSYDFSIKVTEEDYRAMQIRSAISAGVVLPPQAMRLLDMSSGDSLHSALQGLGLKLDPRKAPLEVLVIDQADKKPTEN
jgi:uncharacterized protein (TIGR03435 family)